MITHIDSVMWTLLRSSKHNTVEGQRPPDVGYLLQHLTWQPELAMALMYTRAVVHQSVFHV